MMDSLDKFETIRDGDVVMQFSPDEAAVMREYAVPFAKEALETLSKQWDFKPTGPILIEMFPKHDDFAVRTMGLPGHDRRARRLLRHGRRARFAEGAAAGRIQLAGDAAGTS